MARSIFVVLAATSCAAFFACGSNNKPAETGGAAGSDSAPRVVIESSTETWYEEESGKPGEKGTGVREYVLDVTKRVEWKGGSGGTMVDAGPPPPDKILRVAVRFPVPKVAPDNARDPHVINRLLWDIRKEIAKCYYKGPGKDAGAELSMVGWLQVNKAGEITSSGVEKSDDEIKKSGADECIMANVKGIALSAAGDDTKIRFKLKLQTSEATGAADAKVAPKP
jgi:hypothetical protein